MTRVLSILSIVFVTGIANASQYEGTFESKGTSYSGVSYDRRFKLSVQFLPRTDIIGTAQVEEVSSYCKTQVSFELGKIQIQARDIRTGETVAQTLPWTANVVDSVAKPGDAPCSASNLEGKSVIGSTHTTFELKSAVHGKGTSLYIEAEPAFEGISPANFAMASTLQKISPDTYAVLPFSPNSQALVNWVYVHEEAPGLAWGSSGSVTLKLKN
ncbi:MAG: hypothetical protein ACJ763_09685 [Bdellovibrionia bacterium]